MPIWIATILEIIKVTAPALIVFLTVKYLLQSYLNKEYQVQALALEKKKNEKTLPLQLQAYERLSLFCERIFLPTLLLRVKQPKTSARQLRLQLLLSIQQEYEHNITQQVYVSAQLWEIIKIARDDSVNSIALAMESIPPEADAEALSQAIFQILEKRGITAVDKALQAIKKEAAVLLS